MREEMWWNGTGGTRLLVEPHCWCKQTGGGTRLVVEPDWWNQTAGGTGLLPSLRLPIQCPEILIEAPDCLSKPPNSMGKCRVCAGGTQTSQFVPWKRNRGLGLVIRGLDKHLGAWIGILDLGQVIWSLG